MIDARVKKLPKWAQAYINDLYKSKQNIERDKKQTEEDLQAVLGNKKTSIIVLKVSDEDTYIPDGSMIRFMLGKDDSERQYIDCYIDDRNKQLLRINGGESININPQASNSICIELKRS